ncbi:putative bifunctional diguanylate cyclase/phosphodiesterase [Marinobacter sp. UBA2498]|jgi:diguanylate cyclase (GGDEF)-like protein/PAS domain S-box-containing protein|uniref:putative bifunctional diguanylate cyclase/phosphodiesterase n=1 Tax=Marinobacter sp. UBA2498 TaxID=1946813 RepID=UPI000C5DAFD4|nr:bifunctional diguanylate cyclase/phosphodiesterase [Marinobacter sp. UBA2498]MAO50040.1 diguanylate cyclase [Pusillimonas sp.]MBC43808.1 diguanylate cyclase [Pusillimonas sp.]HCP79067.1 diguanylate cyclase [Pusillimonas sp.]|tara:strand:- start:50415 stop:52532 length:2118 start_codon:yes stop_codon:yes gene_type:complete
MPTLLETATALQNLETLDGPEALFRALAENAVIGVYIVREARFVYVNSKLLDMLGYERDEMLHQMTITNIVAHDERHFVASNIKRALSGEVREIHYERKARCKDGSYIDVEVFGSCMTLAGEAVMVGLMLDMSPHKAEEASTSLMSLVYKHSSEAMVITDVNGVIITVNPAFSDITGYALDEVIGHRLSILSSGRHNENFYKAMWEALLKTGHWRGEIWNRRKSGDEYVERLSIDTSYNDDGSVRCRVGVFSDITQKKRTEEVVWRQANYDHLTGLPNRKLMEERLKTGQARAARVDTRLAFIFLDLDAFKEVNDSLGHDMGDKVLRQVAHRLVRSVRESDTVARFGGDEFVIVMGGVVSDDMVQRTCQAVLHNLGKPYRLKDTVVYLSASAGVAVYPDHASNAEALMQNADLAMHEAKEAGRGQLRFYDPDMQYAARERRRLSKDLLVALDNKELVLYYQPVVDLKTHRLVKAEALIRWKHPEKGFVSPDQFIPFAEDSGMIIAIGEWVFRTAADQLLDWHRRGFTQLQVGLNVSPVQFCEEGLNATEWITYLAKRGLPGSAIVVELTERMLIDAYNGTSEKLLAFRHAGIQVALDDFGTGYSSLAYLRKLDIDLLKIDQSFVRNLSSHVEDLALCEAIVVMAHKLGLKVIAEGVETADQRDLLADIGCDYGQGYLFSRPIPADEFTELLHSGLSAGEDTHGNQ